eukprot:Opistho-2@28264
MKKMDTGGGDENATLQPPEKLNGAFASVICCTDPDCTDLKPRPKQPLLLKKYGGKGAVRGKAGSSARASNSGPSAQEGEGASDSSTAAPIAESGHPDGLVEKKDVPQDQHVSEQSKAEFTDGGVSDAGVVPAANDIVVAEVSQETEIPANDGVAVALTVDCCENVGCVYVGTPRECPIQKARELNEARKAEAERVLWRKRALFLAIFTIIYNIAEGATGIIFGLDDDSFSLVGFGFDSIIEVSSAFVVLYRLSADFGATPIDKTAVIARERTCARVIGAFLCLLALTALGGAIYRLVLGGEPSTGLPGLLVSVASLSFMFFLYYFKTKAANKLNSMTIRKDALCSLGCIQLSIVLFIGSLVYYLAEKYANTHSTWWLDAVATIFIAILIGKEGIETLRAASRDDFDGGCGCCADAGKSTTTATSSDGSAVRPPRRGVFQRAKARAVRVAATPWRTHRRRRASNTSNANSAGVLGVGASGNVAAPAAATAAVQESTAGEGEGGTVDICLTEIAVE